MKLILFIVLVFLMVCCVPVRVLVLNPISSVYYGVRDFISYIHYCKWRNAKDGYIYCFVGLFGKGKTLATVHYIVKQYKRKNDKMIYDFERKKWVQQRINIVSNVDLSVPYVKFTGLQQIVDISKMQHDYDMQHDCRTITLVLGDEFSVQLNSRNFKSNINALFLNSLLTCRHHHIGIVYNAQRFGHVDALLRQVTFHVIDCDKLWRIMVHREYDAWDLENAASPNNIKPLRRYGWFIRDRNFNAYDTLACVDNLSKSCEEGDMLTETEILALQANTGSDMEAVSKPSRKYRHNMKKTHK